MNGGGKADVKVDTQADTAARQTALDSTPTHPGRPLPKAPVLGWSSLWPMGGTDLPSVADLPHRAYTTSGRAALLCALNQLALPPGSGVLVPTYHCPTMVAPIVQAGLKPLFFPIDQEGLPQLDGISAAAAAGARAMFVAHYFGLPKSLLAVQTWCRERGIALVEDCAHSYFGMAGDRPVGTWGDYATASLSKFFPVAEAGLLGSAGHVLQPLNLKPAALFAQAKGAFSVLEYAHLHGRLPGPSHLIAPLQYWRGRKGPQQPTQESNADAFADEPNEAAMFASCDMARASDSPTVAARTLHRMLPEGLIVGRRRRHYQRYAASFAELNSKSVQPLSPSLPLQCAPYVFPLWVNDPVLADQLYARMRQTGLPVFRWDRIWPGTPVDSQDLGTRWSRQLLQLLCHQDLNNSAIDQVVEAT
jgi:dTDP-4-amino-4,6-dideoxygalactose transaminase